MISPGDSECSRASRLGRLRSASQCEQHAVELLGQVVAALVGWVDAALDLGELGVGGSGRAGFVFDVPEIEVGAMLAGNLNEPVVCLASLRLRRVSMPVAGEAIVQRGNCFP